jgi:hypothetical protein
MPFETDKGGGFKIDASDLLKTGVYPERFDRQIPFWETVNGVQYTEFGMRRKAGREELSEGQETFTSLTSNVTQVFSDMPFTIFVNPNYSAYVFYLYVKFDIPFPGKKGDQIKLTGFANIATNILFTQTEKDWFEINKTWTIDRVITTGAYANSVRIKIADTYNDPDFVPVEKPDSGGEPEFPYNAYPTGWQVSDFVLDGGQTAGYRSSTTSTAIRGITATREYEDRVCYFADLTSIKSYRELTQETALVGSGYNLLQSSAATTWDVGSTSWDASLGVTVWDSALNESDQWDFETFGSFVVGAKGSSKPVIKKSNVNFNTFHNDQVSGATILSTNTGGAGYSVGDTLTTTVSPAGGLGLTATVTEVSGDAITAFKITDFGSGYTNGDVVEFSGGTTPATATLTVPNIDFDSLECFHRQGPHMLAFNYTKGAVNYSTSFAWCSADNLDDWVGTAINTAGSLLIREAETPIRCVAQLGTGLAVYTETQMFVVNYVGLPNIFGYQVALEGSVGAVSPNSVISVGRQNYGVSRDGFFVTDGSSVKMIGRESGMNQFFRDEIAQSELSQVYGFDNSKENEVVWGVPLNSSSITKEIYYNYKTNQWGMRDSSISAYLDRGVFQTALSGNNSGSLFREGNTESLANPNVFAITKAHDLNDADRIKEISAIRVGKEGEGNPTLSVGFSSTIDATPTFLQKDSFIIDDTFKSFPIRAAGRYITIKIESNGSSDNWTITNLVVQGRMEGER